jgi:CheY-like chemotaxis protein
MSDETQTKQQGRPGPSKSRCILNDVIPIIPSIAWVVVVAVAIYVFHEPLVTFLTKATSVRIGDVEVRIDASTRSFPASLRPDSSSPEVRRIAKRWQQIPERAQAYRLLVAHDVLSEAKYLQAALSELGFVAEIGLCPTEIEEMLRRHPYDVVLSDVSWSACPGEASENNGIPFLARMHEQGLSRPTVFFVQKYRPELGTPAFATGITDDWYDALNYIVDILARA